MIEALTVYFISQSAVLFWFYSPLKLSLFKLFTKQYSFNHNDFDLLLLSKSPLLKVLTCTFCFSFWTSIAVSLLLSHDALSFFKNFSVSLVLIYLYENIISFLRGGH